MTIEMAGGIAVLDSLESSRSQNCPPAKTNFDAGDRCQRDALKDRHFTQVTRKPTNSYRRIPTCCVPTDLILHILQLDSDLVAVVAMYLRCDITSGPAWG